jgi:hypothetical protein
MIFADSIDSLAGAVVAGGPVYLVSLLAAAAAAVPKQSRACRAVLTHVMLCSAVLYSTSGTMRS